MTSAPGPWPRSAVGRFAHLQPGTVGDPPGSTRHAPTLVTTHPSAQKCLRLRPWGPVWVRDAVSVYLWIDTKMSSDLV